MAVWMICWANLKKKKSVAISMCLLILLSTALFNVGLTFLTGINRFYDQENDRLNGPHYQVRFYGNEYKEEYLEYFRKDDRVSQAEAEDAIMMDMCTLPQGGTLSITYRNLEADREIRGYEIRHLADVPKEKAVYIPVYMKSMGYQPGSELKLVFKKQEYTFQVAGYMTSTWFGSSISSLADFYIPQEAYEKLYAQVGCGKLMSVRVKDTSQLSELRKDFKRDTSVKIEAASLDADVIETHLDEMRTACTMLVTILSVILFAFSFIIVFVGMVVMRFRIASHIDAQMRNIGALGAMGYTGKQITWSIALEFLVIGLAGTLLGIAVSYGMIGMLGKLIVESAGIPWSGGARVGSALFSVIIMMAVILVTSQTAAGKAARIRPIQALRGGLESHDFSKSYFPLERTPGNLSLVLGLKNMMFHKKTYAMVGTIVAGVTFACAFALVLYQNMGMDDRVLVEMSGFEISELMVYKAPHADIKKLEEELLAVDGVRKTSMYEITSVSIEEETISAYVSDDFGELEMMKPYEGEFPVYDNEIGLTGVLAKRLGKKIGDTLKVEYQGVEAEYVISGLGQTMSNFGRQCFLNTDGLRRVNPSYERNSILVYLEDGYDTTEMIDVLENRFDVLSPSGSRENDEKADAKRKAEEKLANLISMYGVDSVQFALMRDGEIVLSGDTSSYQIDRIENTEKMFVSNINSVAAAVGMVSVIILLGTVLIITLVFYIVIKSMIIRRKHEFGIFKAVGYTDRQLMQQVAASFLPVSVLGAAAGCVVSTMAINPIASRLFEQVGISRMDFVINPLVLTAMSVALVLFAFLISMGVAGKIKGISVYSLLTED